MACKPLCMLKGNKKAQLCDLYSFIDFFPWISSNIKQCFYVTSCWLHFSCSLTHICINIVVWQKHFLIWTFVSSFYVESLRQREMKHCSKERCSTEGFVGRVWHQASGYLMWFQRQQSTRVQSRSLGADQHTISPGLYSSKQSSSFQSVEAQN